VRDEWNIPYDAFVIGRVGRLSGSKLVHETVLATAACYHTIPDIYCVVGGTIPQDEGSAYNDQMLDTFGKHPAMVFPGEARDAVERANWLNAMDLCCYPTQGEGFGMIFLEAIHQGLPILTYDNGANKYVVGEAGWCLPWSDEQHYRTVQLMNKINQIYDMYKNVPSAMDAWKSRVRERGANYTSVAYGQRMMEIYRRVLS
jgi:glycosyltransferase involved in cell wall biosynthesis